MKRIVDWMRREPLVLFFTIAGLLYGIQGYFAPKKSETACFAAPRPRVDATRLERAWQKEWGRLPSAAERRALSRQAHLRLMLFDRAIREGVAYQDRMVFERLIRKERALLQSGMQDRNISEDRLKRYYRAHLDAYREGGCYRFAQITLPLNTATPIARAYRLRALLEEAHVLPEEAAKFSAPIKAKRVDLCLDEIQKRYGRAFATQLHLMRLGSWSGPIVTEQGLMLLYPITHRGGAVLPFEKVRGVVEEDFRHSLAQKRYEAAISRQE